MGGSAMGFPVILGSVFAHQAESMSIKRYGDKHGKGGMFFNAIICLFAVIFYLLSDKGGLIFPGGVVIYGLINSCLYATGFYTGYLAYVSGSFGLTKLITSFTCIIPIFYGIVFAGESQSPIFYVAFALILMSLFLMRFQKTDADGSKVKFSPKWIISVVLVIVSNGFISILGKMQHAAFGDTYKNEFLITTYIGSAFWLLLMGFLFERRSFRSTVKYGVLYGAVAGLCNGIGNWLNLTSYNYLDLSVSVPIKTGAGLVLSFLVSLIIFKERFSVRQIIAVILGTLAVILINLA